MEQMLYVDFDSHQIGLVLNNRQSGIPSERDLFSDMSINPFIVFDLLSELISRNVIEGTKYDDYQIESR